MLNLGDTENDEKATNLQILGAGKEHMVVMKVIVLVSQSIHISAESEWFSHALSNHNQGNSDPDQHDHKIAKDRPNRYGEFFLSIDNIACLYVFLFSLF